jgi:hypothetical protein
VRRLKSGIFQHLNPTRGQIHIDDGLHALASVISFFGKSRGVTKGLQNIFTFKIGIVSENLVDAASSAYLADNHANRHAHATNASLTAHHIGLLSNAIQLLHGPPLSLETMWF